MAEHKTDPLRYAKDVLLAYDYWKRPMPADVGSSSAQEIHEWANTPGTQKEFLAMVKNATDQIQKANKDLTPDDMMRSERKSIGELKGFVAEAVAKSQEISV